ncbi:hypothetical protein BU17DRAFT_67048 [Hysterangium stoloniferum]|nr:hypothetical protein BU17DRAFT_67048 [Hysterangium stoloniferum]
MSSVIHSRIKWKSNGKYTLHIIFSVGLMVDYSPDVHEKSRVAINALLMFEPDFNAPVVVDMPADWPYSRIPPRFSSIEISQTTDNELSAEDMRWISALRPPAMLSYLPDEAIERLGTWCVEPLDLLKLSSTCKRYARLLRTVNVWLEHHHLLGYDTGILYKKVKHAAASPEQKYGPDGWGLLVKSAVGKAEFPDSNISSQVRKKKILPHTFLTYNADDYYVDWQPRPTEEEIKHSPESQARGRYYIQVMFDILTEHDDFMYAEVLCIQLHDTEENEYYRWLQAMISASFVFIRTFDFRVHVYPLNSCVSDTKRLIEEMKRKPFLYRKSSKRSLTYTFLCACSILYIDAYAHPDHHRSAQVERRLYPPPPIGKDIWEDDKGAIRPGAWSRTVQQIWNGRVYVMGQYARVTSEKPTEIIPFPQPKLAHSFLRMQLDFLPNGDLTGFGGDYGGDFVITGSYKKTYVEMVKRYTDDEGGIYHAAGHMLPWGIYGHWYEDPGNGEDANRFGYWGIWIYEGADAIPLEFPVHHKGRWFIQRRKPYRTNPSWFDQYLARKVAGVHIDRAHGFNGKEEDVPPFAPDAPLPETDVFGF